MNVNLALVLGIVLLLSVVDANKEKRRKLKNKVESANEDDGRIVNGTPVQGSAVPYQASVMQVGKGHFCGGSIISPNHILTAAHCLHDLQPHQISVRTGATEVNKGGVVVPVAKILRHPEYNKNTVNNDLAVLKTATPIQSGAMVRLAATEPPVNTWALITGWGLPDENADSPTKFLNYAWMPIIARSDCQTAYSKLNTITTKMLCAGFKNGKTDACQGDSGGPMVVNDLQVGVVSWGRGCARAGQPGVFASVPANLPWIMEAVRKL